MVQLQLVHGSFLGRPGGTLTMVHNSSRLETCSSRNCLKHASSSCRAPFLPARSKYGVNCSRRYTLASQCSNISSLSGSNSLSAEPRRAIKPQHSSNLDTITDGNRLSCSSSSDRPPCSGQPATTAKTRHSSSCSSSGSAQSLREPPQRFAAGAAFGMAAGMCLCSERHTLRHLAAVAECSCSQPPAPWGLVGSAGLPLPHRFRRRNRAAVRTAAFAGAAASASSTSWHQAIGLTFRGVMWGIVFTLGAQLLLALLLRTIWAQRAIAALESWLQAVFGVSLRSGRASYSTANSIEEESDDEDAISIRSNGSSSSRSSSSSSISGVSGNGASSDSSSYSSVRRSRSKKEGRKAADRAARAAMVHNAPGESVEWVNMCFRKIWRVYQRGLERWITDLLQPVFDALINPNTQPGWLLRLRIVELTLDHEAPYFSNMRRRNSRKDSDLTGVVDLRYTGGARLLLMLELGQGRWRFKIPVLVSDLDVQCALWLKLRLAPMCPWIGTISLAFVGPPAVKVQLSPYNRVRLMRIPVLQNLLNRLLTVDLPALMVLPERLEISVPPSVTSIAEAAVGRDTIMRAVASAVLQVDSLEQALLAALPLGPQCAAGGVSLPELFRGELTVLLREGRDLPVWGMPWQSNPWVRLVLGEQAVASRRDSETSTASRHGAPVWNQAVQFLVEDPEKQVLEVFVNDSHLTGRPKVGKAVFQLKDLPPDGRLSLWLPLEPVNAGQRPQGEVHLDLTYKVFEDDDQDSGYREAQEYAKAVQQQSEAITDIRSAAAASSRAAVAASAAISAIAMTKAAAARAAARAAQAAKDASTAVANTAAAAVSGQQVQQGTQQQQQQQQAAEGPLMLPPPGQSSAALTDKQREATAAAAAAAAAATAAVAAGTSDGARTTSDKGSKDRSRDGGDGGGGDGTGGAPAAAAVTAAEAVSAAAELGEDVEAVAAAAAEAAAAARRREEALIEALEARMAFRVRSTSSTPKPHPASAAVHGNGSSNGTSAAAAAAAAGGDVKSADVSVTLPADSLSDSDESDEEAKAAERAQKAVVNILEKSKRMEAAVAELAALSAGSPTEAALQQGAIKAAAEAVAALSAFQSTDTVPGGSSSSGGGGASYPAAAARVVGAAGGRGGSGSSVDGMDSSSSSAAAADRPLQEAASSSRSNATGDGAGQNQVIAAAANGSGNGSSKNGSSSRTENVSSISSHFGDFGSGYSIWGEELPPRSPLQSYAEPTSPIEQHVPTPEEASEYSIWGEQLSPVQQDQPQQQQPVNPSIVVRVMDGEHVLSEVVGGAHDKAVQTDSATSADKAVQAGGTGVAEAAKEAGGKPWWESVVFWLPGQKRAGTAAAGSSSSSDQGEEGSVCPESPEPHVAMNSAEPISTAHRAWWQPLIDNDFVKSLPGIAPHKGDKQQQQQDAAQAPAAAAADQDGSSDTQREKQQQQQQKQRNWWEIDLPWFKGSSSGEDDAAAAAAADGIEVIADGANKPVEAIVIPADLPLEEIAKEVAKLKEDAWKSKEDHLENLWAKTVERNDRSWLMLLCFLLTVAIGLLSVVAWRIGGLASGDIPAQESVETTAAVVQQLPVMLLGLAAAAAAHFGMWP